MMLRRIGALAVSSTSHFVMLALLLVASSTSSGRSSTLPSSRVPSITVFTVPRDDDTGPAGLNPIDATEDGAIRLRPGSETLALPEFTANVAKIAGRAPLLFPFVTPGLSLKRFAIAPEREIRESFHDPFAPPRETPSTDARRRPPLTLSDAALQAVIDRSWSRRDRWTPFQQIVKLANTFSPDAGQLPALLHAYHRQNGLQPYVDRSIRDPRLWAELGLAADHVEFIGFISGFASAHPGTKATIELLFLLDQLAQANMDALLTLLDTDPAESLAWTREANRDAYQLIVDLRRHYAKQLQRKKLASSSGIAGYYDKVRLDILTGILRTTPHGYRANDARFLIGAIHWREGSVGDALRSWRGMTTDPTDAYATSIAQILDAIATETGGDRGSADSRETMRRLAARINGILRAEHGRWIMFSIDRLQQFGFHFDTF
jgi:hypothetical protein